MSVANDNIKEARKRLRQLERLRLLIQDILDECDEPKPDKQRAVDPCATEQGEYDRAVMDEMRDLQALSAASDKATESVQARMDAEMALTECRANIGVGTPDEPPAEP